MTSPQAGQREGPVLVVGAGAWGSALANAFARGGSRTLLWDDDAALIEHIQRCRCHPRFATEVVFEKNVEAVARVDAVVRLDCVLFVVPFQMLGHAMRDVAGSGVHLAGVACASKGFELETHRMAHEIATSVWTSEMPFAQLSGPNFAIEVMQGAPAAISVASSNREFGWSIAHALHSPRFRPYFTDDVVGVEVGGALKNIIAIAAGIADGLDLGSNTRAALITRGLAEIARFGRALGGRMETFMGLSGMGDLVLTCTDNQSRNRRFGLALARLGNAAAAIAEVGALVEGAATARAVAEMARERRINMPIVGEIDAILRGEVTASLAVERLLARDPTVESE